MSWLSRWMGQPAPAPASAGPVGGLRGDGSYALACVGESNYVAALLAAAGTTRRDPGPIEEFVEVRLRREPENPYDLNAVVVLSSTGRKLAYLSREDAVELGPTVGRGDGVPCSARIGGRRVRGSDWRIGIWLDVAW